MDREKQIEEMTKFVCMDCRYFMKCNDDTMCDGRPLGEVLKEGCFTRKYAEALYNAGYRKQNEVIEEYIEKVYDEMKDYMIFSRDCIEYILQEVKKEKENDD